MCFPVRSVEIGFPCFNPSTDPPDSDFGIGDLPPTVTGVGSAGFRAGSAGLGGWVGYRVWLDTPTLIFHLFLFLFLDFFWTTCSHLPHLTPTTHLTNISTLFGRPSLIFHLFLFLFFSLKHTPLYHFHTLPPIPPCHHLHHHFSDNVIRKSLRT